MANYKDNFIKSTFFWSMVEKTEVEMVSPTIFIFGYGNTLKVITLVYLQLVEYSRFFLNKYS